MQNLMNPSAGQRESVGLAPLNRDPSSQEMDQAIRDATFAIDNLDWLNPGDTVFIKPVISSSKPYPAITSPPLYPSNGSNANTRCQSRRISTTTQPCDSASTSACFRLLMFE